MSVNRGQESKGSNEGAENARKVRSAQSAGFVVKCRVLSCSVTRTRMFIRISSGGERKRERIAYREQTYVAQVVFNHIGCC